jgi:hypothetical protein
MNVLALNLTKKNLRMFIQNQVAIENWMGMKSGDYGNEVQVLFIYLFIYELPF